MLPARIQARHQRVGGIDVAPGHSTRVSISAAGKAGASAVEGWLSVGREPGPRVTIVAATRGFEVAATLAARSLTREIDCALLRGSVLVVPVFRPASRFARAGRAVPVLPMPGDAGGGPRARLAFALHAEAVVGSQVVLVLGGPLPGRQSVLTVEGDLADPRVRKLAVASGAVAAVAARGAVGSVLRAAVDAGRTALRLSAAGAPAGVRADADALLAALRRVLASAGVYPFDVEPEAPAPPAMVQRLERVRASADGVIDESVAVGTAVAKSTTLARVASATGGRFASIKSPEHGILLEAPDRPVARRKSVSFVIGVLAPRDARRVPPAAARAATTAPEKIRCGWVERVSLPDLGLTAVQAKIDTGARTSALHVTSSRVVGGGPGRPILEIALAGTRRGTVLRLPVREFVEVRDTSGRTERRPAIETTLELGPIRRRIRLTLTDRGDMTYPMLVGRTALGGSIVVDPGARFLLRPRATRPKES